MSESAKPSKPYILTDTDRKFLRSLRIEPADGRVTGRRASVDVPPHLFAEGDYGRNAEGAWFARTPNGILSSLEKLEVEEHEDGTISIASSVRVTERFHGSNLEWQGTLIRGTWSAC